MLKIAILNKRKNQMKKMERKRRSKIQIMSLRKKTLKNLKRSYQVTTRLSVRLRGSKARK